MESSPDYRPPRSPRLRGFPGCETCGTETGWDKLVPVALASEKRGFCLVALPLSELVTVGLFRHLQHEDSKMANPLAGVSLE